MKDNIKNKRAAFLRSLRNNKLKSNHREVILEVKRNKLGNLGIRIGLRGNRNMAESIGSWAEAKKEGSRE